MSKININSNIGEFLNKNKVRICAIALSTVMVGSLSACRLNTNKVENSSTTSISQQYEQELLKMKENIIKNIENMQVMKDEHNGNGAYQISEELFEEYPIYETDEKGNKYVSRYGQKSRGIWLDYTVSYEAAEKMGIKELLESNVVYVITK